MTSHEATSASKPPLFDGTNFSFWRIRMRTYLMALGADVWYVVETRYTRPVVLASKDDKLEFIFNAKGMNAILNGLAEVEFVKVTHLDTTKGMWDKLINNYEGNEKVKDAKLQTYRLKFEQLKMNEYETISKYFLRVEEFLNAMKGPHQKKDQNSDDEKKYKYKKYNKKKSLVANNDNSSEDTDSDSSCENKANDFILMAKEDYDNKITGSDANDEEVVVDLEG
jgi:hypothetical protein